MIEKLSRVIPKPVAKKKAQDIARHLNEQTTKKLLQENLESLDTFVSKEMPAIKKSASSGLSALEQLSQTAKNLLPK